MFDKELVKREGELGALPDSWHRAVKNLIMASIRMAMGKDEARLLMVDLPTEQDRPFLSSRDLISIHDYREGHCWCCGRAGCGCGCGYACCGSAVVVVVVGVVSLSVLSVAAAVPVLCCCAGA